MNRAMTRRLLPALLICAAAMVAGCAGRPAGDDPAAAGAGTASLTAASLVDALRGAGLTVRDGGTVSQPFFSVPARVYEIDGRDLQIYEFASPAAAEQAAADVAPSGSPIGTAMVTWMSDPHFFRKDRLVVNYIGTSDAVLAELRRLLGPQFAGR